MSHAHLETIAPQKPLHRVWEDKEQGLEMNEGLTRANQRDSPLEWWWWFVYMSVAQSCPVLGTPWTAAHQTPLSMGFLRQEYWSGLPRPPPQDLPDPGIEPPSPALQAKSLPLSHQGFPFTGVTVSEEPCTSALPINQKNVTASFRGSK